MNQSSLEVEFHTGPFALAGQIDYPNDTDTFPVVLIVPGPPQHDRHGNVRGYKGYNNYFEPLTQKILEAGYAVFRWDKGGTGKSSSGLSAPMNMVSAYRKMCSMPRVEPNKTAILAFGGGSAFVYRKWLELEEINPIYHLTLLSTGVNDLKIQDLQLPICLVASQGRMLRSRRALEKYSDQKNVRVKMYEAESANEQLLDESGGKVNMFNDESASWHQESLEVISEWFRSFQ